MILISHSHFASSHRAIINYPLSIFHYLPMVKHIVMFKLSGTADERLAVARRFRDALVALPASIDVLRSIEVGINENPAEDWDVVLTAVVDNMADVAIYAAHPAHVAAAALLVGHKEARACVDYVC